jgi:hypothetical protein
MRITGAVLVFMLMIVLLPSLSYSDVRLTLKNGSTIVADICRDKDGKLVCEKMGGTFELDKDEILQKKEFSTRYSEPDAGAEKIAEPGTSEEKPDTEESEAGETETTSTGKAVLVRGKDPEAEARIEEIHGRKSELKRTRDNLIKEQEQLNEEIRNTGMEWTEERASRLSDLEERIGEFNDEVQSLDRQEQELIETLSE